MPRILLFAALALPLLPLPALLDGAAPAAAQPAMAGTVPIPPPGPGQAQFLLRQMGPAPTLLSVTASAGVSRAPDMLRLTAAVVTTAPGAAEAMAANAARMNAVLAALKGAGVAAADLQTTGLSLSPQYRYVQDQPPVLTGYQARNAIALRTTRLAAAGQLVDAAVKAGANEVQGPDFLLADPDAALDGARVAAIAKARARAELYARAAGLRVKRITSIGEGGSAPNPGPQPMMRLMAADAAPTPVQPGRLDLEAQVTVNFELEPLP